MSLFLEYLNKQKHGVRILAERKLKLIRKSLEKNFLEIEDFTSDCQQPYLFVYDPTQNLSFGGIRIYTNNEIVAFRTQKLPETQPYGNSYQLDIQQMLDDILDNTKEKDKNKIAEMLMKLLTSVIRQFFIKSIDAEAEEAESITSDLPKDMIGSMTTKKDTDAIAVRNTGTDYSSNIFSKSN